MKSNTDIANIPFFRIQQKQVINPVSEVVPLVSLLLELHPHPTLRSASAFTQFQEAPSLRHGLYVTGLTFTLRIGRPRLGLGRGGIGVEVGA